MSLQRFVQVVEGGRSPHMVCLVAGMFEAHCVVHIIHGLNVWKFNCCCAFIIAVVVVSILSMPFV